MNNILVLGAGGHGKVVADILTCCGHTVLGFLDDNPALWNTEVMGFPVLGDTEKYQNLDCSGLAMAIGSNKIRRKIVEHLGSPAKSLWINAIHPSAIIARSARIGHGVVLAAQSVVNPDAQIGNFVIINTSATVDHDCKIGDFAHIAPGSHLAGNVIIGQSVLLGVGSQIIPGCTVGDWSVVGAGATVIRNIPENVTAKGTPARW